jgi:serine/threonine protein kinase
MVAYLTSICSWNCRITLKTAFSFIRLNPHPRTYPPEISGWLEYRSPGRRILGTGITVSSFWSPGYAAPEQRLKHRTSEQSDLYALDSVFYHLLSRRQPPPEGPTPDLVNTLAVPPRIKQLLAERSGL